MQSPSHYIDETGRGRVYMDTYENMNVNGQRHHVNQDVAYGSAIPYKDGLCVELYGNAFKDTNSWHYKAHQSLETFWADYRKGGSKIWWDKPTNGQYNRALYD